MITKPGHGFNNLEVRSFQSTKEKLAMKASRYALFVLLVFVSTAALAQSDAQKSFDKLKSLAGSWQGKTSQGSNVKVNFRVTSGGSALMSEILGEENMISMIHLDGDRVLMTHYCGAGNQPRFKATTSPDGKTVNFDFLDATNLATAQAGHMNHVVFQWIDADHHTEEWTFLQDGKEKHERFDLQRVKGSGASM
jgi:hypothetical protein